MGRCKMVLLLLKTGYNKYSELYWPSYVHFNSGAAFRVGFHWRRALPPHFSRHLLHIHQFQHSSNQLGLFGDVPSHPKLCRHLLLHQQPTSRLWVIHKPTLHRSPFARPYTVSIIVGHKHYRVSLSSDLRSSWLWVIHKPTVHRSPFARPHTVRITVGHKHYRVSLSSDLHLSGFWVNHVKPLSSVDLHIQQRLGRRELYAMGTIAS